MIECLILGDSIAKGLADVRKECVQLVQPGINSKNYVKKFGENMIITELNFDTVVISLGSNDDEYVKTEVELRRLRDAIRAKNVFWIIPGEKKAAQRNAVIDVAMARNDRLVEIFPISKDGIHATRRGYEEMAKRTKQ